MITGLILGVLISAAQQHQQPAPTDPRDYWDRALFGSSGRVAHEPFFADIVRRARILNAEVSRFTVLAAANTPLPRYEGFKADLTALSALNLQGHFELKARGHDGDLRYLLERYSENLPKLLAEYEAARTVESRVEALKELGYLLSDNVDVITYQPVPATPPPARKKGTAP